MKDQSQKEETYSEIDGLHQEFFENNRKKYLNNLKIRFPNFVQNSVLALEGGKNIPKYDSDVNYYYFDQESNFYYLTGVREPDMKCIIDFQDGSCTLFFQPEPEDYKIWTTIQTKEDIEKKYGIPTLPMSEFNSLLQKRNMEKIYVLDGTNPYSGLPVCSIQLDFQGQYNYLNKRVSHDKYIYMVLSDTRMVKTEEEKKLLKFIGSITNDAHKKVMKAIKPGLTERHMENVFCQYLRDKYYTRFWGYNCICAGGKDSATLHYDLNNKEFKDGDLFLADLGIRFCGYVSDVTITIPVNGKFTEKQKKIYNIVLEANRKTIEMMKPNVTTYAEMNKFSKIVILEGLKKIGILKDFPAEKMYEDGLWKTFMPHGLGHLVGLDVHDVGTNVTYKKDLYLENGTFITVEPGIYFIDFLMDQAIRDQTLKQYINIEEFESYRGFGGIRIEDDIMVNETGVEMYQKDLPRTVEEIEAFMESS